MTPNKPTSNTFTVAKNVYADQLFVVAYGKDGDGVRRLAMRWRSGELDEEGYFIEPENPEWFLLPAHTIWIPEIMKSLRKIEKYARKMQHYELNLIDDDEEEDEGDQ